MAEIDDGDLSLVSSVERAAEYVRSCPHEKDPKAWQRAPWAGVCSRLRVSWFTEPLSSPSGGMFLCTMYDRQGVTIVRSTDSTIQVMGNLGRASPEAALLIGMLTVQFQKWANKLGSFPTCSSVEALADIILREK